MSIPKLFTIDEVAAILRAPRTTITDWIYRGLLASVKLGRHRRVRAEAIDAFIAAGESPVRSQR